MAKLKGRPPKVRKQEKNIGFFVTKLQYFVIQQKAEKAGVNISDYMRQVAVNAQVKTKWTEEERGMVKGLIEISADLHRMVEMGEKQGVAEAMLFFVRYRGMFDSIFNKLCHDR